MTKFWLLIITSFFLWPLSAKAFTVSPTRTLLTVDPGGKANITINLKNDSKEKRNYELETLTFSQNEKGEVVYERRASQAEEWVKTSISKMMLDSEESRKINYVVEVPKNAPAGSYYLALGIKELRGGEGELGLSGQIISLVTIQVAGSITENLEIKAVKSLQSVYFSTPWKAEIAVKNLSPIEVPLQGKVFLKDPFGELIAYENLALGRDVLANSERRTQFDLWEKEKILMPGVYHLYFDITYGKTGGKIGTEIAVWYLPNWFLVTAAGVLVLVVFLSILKRISKKRND